MIRFKRIATIATVSLIATAFTACRGPKEQCSDMTLAYCINNALCTPGPYSSDECIEHNAREVIDCDVVVDVSGPVEECIDTMSLEEMNDSSCEDYTSSPANLPAACDNVTFYSK